MMIIKFLRNGLLAVGLVLATALTALAQPAVLVGKQPGSRVNVRSSPSTSAPSPSYGLVGDRVTVLNTTNTPDGYTWHYVQFPSGTKGWVRGDFVRITDEGVKADQAVLVGKQPGSRVNVRSSPSTSAPSPSYGLVGDKVEILSFTNAPDGYRWYYVKFKSGVKGWVRGDFVEPLYD
jgi:serine/threonine-protein kinase